MDYQALKTLIQTNPNWQTLSDQIVADWCNEEVIDVNKDTLPNQTILAAILNNRTEFTALSANDQQIVRDILYIGDSVPTDQSSPQRAAMVSIFGASSATIQALAAELVYQISRAANVGILQSVSADHVAHARTV